MFWLRSSVLARVVPAGPGAVAARRAVDVARWLEGVDFPAVRLAGSSSDLVEAGGYVVTFWRPVSPGERIADLGEIGEVVRLLHWLREPSSLGLELLDPVARVVRGLDAAGGLAEADRAFLRERAEALGRRFEELNFVLQSGMLHGSESLDDFVVDVDGHVVLSSVDGFAVGPREWDLSLVAVAFERFVAGYGFDVLNWYGYETLAAVRELAMTVDLAARGTTGEQVTAEVSRRIEDLRTGGDRHGWQSL